MEKTKIVSYFYTVEIDEDIYESDRPILKIKSLPDAIGRVANILTQNLQSIDDIQLAMKHVRKYKETVITEQVEIDGNITVKEPSGFGRE
jgi:hypothetical protein